MGKKKIKLKLEDLKVQSFVLDDFEKQEILGGTFGACEQTNYPGGGYTCTYSAICPTGPETCETRPPVHCPDTRATNQTGYCCLTNPAQTGTCCRPGGGGGGGRGCFLKGVQVNIGIHDYKSIESFKINDPILTLNLKTNEHKQGIVRNIFRSKQDFYFIINDQIKTTANHPFFVNGEWIEVKDIKVGDCLKDVSNNEVNVQKIEKVNQGVEVYNLTVDDFHTFFVHNILVHNKTFYRQRNEG